MGSFCLFSFLVFGAWAGLLFTFRDDVISKSASSSQQSSDAYSAAHTEDEPPDSLKNSPGKGKGKKMSTSAGAVSMEPDEVVDIDLEDDDSEAF